VPLLVCGKRLGKPRSLGVRRTFSDLGATVADALALPPLGHGTSFYEELLQK
jgi:phosphopentomutase